MVQWSPKDTASFSALSLLSLAGWKLVLGFAALCDQLQVTHPHSRWGERSAPIFLQSGSKLLLILPSSLPIMCHWPEFHATTNPAWGKWKTMASQWECPSPQLPEQVWGFLIWGGGSRGHGEAQQYGHSLVRRPLPGAALAQPAGSPELHPGSAHIPPPWERRDVSQIRLTDEDVPEKPRDPPSQAKIPAQVLESPPFLVLRMLMGKMRDSFAWTLGQRPLKWIHAISEILSLSSIPRYIKRLYLLTALLGLHQQIRRQDGAEYFEERYTVRRSRDPFRTGENTSNRFTALLGVKGGHSSVPRRGALDNSR